MTRDFIGVGVVGIGFMGKVHIGAVQAAREAGYPCRLVAVCDKEASRRRGRVEVTGNLDAGAKIGPLFDPEEVTGYAELDGLLADSDVDLVSVCTQTETHVDFAAAALAAGKHVLVEKPVALTAAKVAPLVAASKDSDRLIMPAHCIRFWPGWEWLRERIEDGIFGAVRSATFQRLASPPAWAPDFYRNYRLSGGALVDLHIHDADFVRHCFGDPDEVVAAGSVNHVSTMYRFENGPSHVVAEGAWDHTPGFEFRMRYIVNFDDATADYDLGRDPALLLIRRGSAQPVQLEPLAGYDLEIRRLVSAIADGRPEAPVRIEEAEAVARLLDAEQQSLDSRAAVKLASSP